MSDKRKPPPSTDSHRKVQPDDRGRSVWVDPVRTAEFELVSTQTLQAMLDAGDADHLDEFERIASDEHEGYLAQDSTTGRFRIIDDDSLQAILDEQREQPFSPNNIGDTGRLQRPRVDGAAEGEQELSLVSTQALRRILGEAGQDTPMAKKKRKKDEGGGFDPYDTG